LPALWRLVTKFAFFGGVALTTGATVVYLAAVRPTVSSASTDPADRDVLTRRSALVMAWTGLILLAVLYPQLAGKAARAGDGMPYAEALTPSAVWHYVSAAPKQGEWISTGNMAHVQFAMFGVFALLQALLFVRPVRTAIRAIAWICGIGLPVAEMILLVPTTFSGQTVSGVVAHFLTSLHPAAGCMWVGGLVAMGSLAGARRHLSAGAGLVWARMWKRFSIVAQVCVGAVLVTGLWMGFESLGSVAQLWETTFGRILMVKLMLVLTLLVIGGLNEFLLLPRIARLRADGDERGLFAVVLHHFPRVVAAEAALGIAVLVVVPFLNGTGREEAGGVADPPPTGGIFTAVALLFVAGVTCFIATAKVHGAIERSARERRATVSTA